MFTKRDLIATVRQIAKEYPDAIYQGGCMYSHGRVHKGPDTEGCLIGQAIRRLDPDLISFIGTCSQKVGSDTFCKLLPPRYDNSIFKSDWLLEVQSKQDYGATWAKSVELADQLVSERFSGSAY